ncbi:hypothetical protein B0H19DRAFT_1266784 [Mycena capillaripes]|nr:hypothetical protein B0H19DRAFT_1266784 [Mycena capillaripes]
MLSSGLPYLFQVVAAKQSGKQWITSVIVVFALAILIAGMSPQLLPPLQI